MKSVQPYLLLWSRNLLRSSQNRFGFIKCRHNPHLSNRAFSISANQASGAATTYADAACAAAIISRTNISGWLIMGE